MFKEETKNTKVIQFSSYTGTRSDNQLQGALFCYPDMWARKTKYFLTLDLPTCLSKANHYLQYPCVTNDLHKHSIKEMNFRQILSNVLNTKLSMRKRWQGNSCEDICFLAEDAIVTV